MTQMPRGSFTSDPRLTRYIGEVRQSWWDPGSIPSGSRVIRTHLFSARSLSVAVRRLYLIEPKLLDQLVLNEIRYILEIETPTPEEAVIRERLQELGVVELMEETE